MDMYPENVLPDESKKAQNSPEACFDLGNGSPPHTWRVTCVSLIYWMRVTSDPKSPKGRGLIQLDPCDRIIFDGLCRLMTRNETIPPSKWEERFGLGQVLSELFHIISHNWSTFISEAEMHLQNIVSHLIS